MSGILLLRFCRKIYTINPVCYRCNCVLELSVVGRYIFEGQGVEECLCRVIIVALLLICFYLSLHFLPVDNYLKIVISVIVFCGTMSGNSVAGAAQETCQTHVSGVISGYVNAFTGVDCFILVRHILSVSWLLSLVSRRVALPILKCNPSL